MQLASKYFLTHRLYEWLKLIELTMAMVLDSLEDQRWFSTLNQTKLRNRLTTHLDFVVGCTWATFVFHVETFPFAKMKFVME